MLRLRHYCLTWFDMKILAGDIGGTKTSMQIAAMNGVSYQVICEKLYASAEHAEFSDVLTRFLQEHAAHIDNLDVACFGIAGPITQESSGQKAKVTNLPWHIDSRRLSTLTRIPRTYLINDFQAVGYGIDTLQNEDLHILQAGKLRKRAPCIVVGAGTGLGVGQRVWQQDHYEVLATEGGHVDFAPTTKRQMELLDYLSRRFEHVSYERVLSGPGLVTLYEFLCSGDDIEESPELQQAMKESDPAAAIASAAINHNDPLANEALELFVAIYGAMAGNLALINLAFGGVYIAGGIAPKIITRLANGNFMQAFTDKGRMAALLKAVPVSVVMNPAVGLRGAARAGYYLALAR